MRIYQWNELKQIAFELLNNKAAILETDTVIGIVCKESALIYEIKKRSKSKKLIYLVNSIDSVPQLNSKEKSILKKYWPGALTIIKNGIGYRMPNHQKLLELIEITGELCSSSANISGKNPILDTHEGINIFKKFTNDLVIVDGKQQSDLSSTIIDFDSKKIVRLGSIEPNAIINQLK